MKIAYLCDKEHYLKKMSRVRFHSMQAIERLCGEDNFLWTGPNWDSWDKDKTVDEKLKAFLIQNIQNALDIMKCTIQTGLQKRLMSLHQI